MSIIMKQFSTREIIENERARLGYAILNSNNSPASYTANPQYVELCQAIIDKKEDTHMDSPANKRMRVETSPTVSPIRVLMSILIPSASPLPVVKRMSARDVIEYERARLITLGYAILNNTNSPAYSINPQYVELCHANREKLQIDSPVNKRINGPSQSPLKDQPSSKHLYDSILCTMSFTSLHRRSKTNNESD